MRSKARNIGYILDSKDLSKNYRHKKLYGPNELMEQPNTYKNFNFSIQKHNITVFSQKIYGSYEIMRSLTF